MEDFTPVERSENGQVVLRALIAGVATVDSLVEHTELKKGVVTGVLNALADRGLAVCTPGKRGRGGHPASFAPTDEGQRLASEEAPATAPEPAEASPAEAPAMVDAEPSAEGEIEDRFEEALRSTDLEVVSATCGEIIGRKDDLEAEKAATMKAYSKRIATLDARLSDLGERLRELTSEEFIDHELGLVIRKDKTNGRVLGSRPLAPEERQVTLPFDQQPRPLSPPPGAEEDEEEDDEEDEDIDEDDEDEQDDG